MKIYAEWINENGNFDNGFFPNWEAFHAFMFNPSIILTLVKLMK